MIHAGGAIVAALAIKRFIQADARRVDKNLVRYFWSWSILVVGALGLLVSVASAGTCIVMRNDPMMLFFGLELFMPALMVFALPWILTRYVCRPLGMSRAAFVLTRWLSIRLGKRMNSLAQVLATAAIEGARALAFSKEPLEQRREKAEWLRAQLRRGNLFHGGTAVALACIEAALGERERARDMFALVLHTDFVAPGYWDIASEWLSLEAAERGAWHEIRAREHLARPKSRVGALIDGLVHAWDDASERRSETFRRKTWVRWALSPGRARLKDFVTAAMERGTPAWEPEHVHAAHVACLRAGSVSCEQALILANRWEGRLREAPENDANAAFRREVLGDLTLLLERNETYPDLESFERGTLRRDLLDRVSARLEAELRRAFHAAPIEQAKTPALHALDVLDGWHAWAGISRTWHAFESLVGASVASRLFQDEWYVVQTWAIALHNESKQYPFAHALYVWLARTAKARGFDDGVATHTKNTEIARSARWST